MKFIVIFLLCVALVFGASSVPIIFSSTIGGLAYVANFAGDLLLPETINPSNVQMTVEMATSINEHLSFDFIDTDNLDRYIIASNLYANMVDGTPYVVVRLVRPLSNLPFVGDIFTSKYLVPALSRSVNIVYGMITSYSAVQVYPLVVGSILPKVVQLQETNINTQEWIGENWNV